MPNIRATLDARVSAAMAAGFPDAAGAPAIVQPAQDPRFGDYQANGAMALAKRLKQNPREVAAAVVEQLKGDAHLAAMVEEPEIAGPGFINFRLRPEWVAEQLGKVNTDVADGSGLRPKGEERLGVEPAAEPETVVVDYSAPNLAKEMHVGHLRSTIIGDALVRMLDFAGHNVERQNHVGDWGTQFGMLMAELESRQLLMEYEFPDGEVEGPIGQLPDAVSDLEGFYRDAKAHFDEDENFAQRARQLVVQLQAEDEWAYAVWWKFLRISLAHCDAVYSRLDVLLTDDDVRGESAYNSRLLDIVRVLEEQGLLTKSEGAQCVFLKDAAGKPLFANKDGDPLPLIVRKADEGYLYATTDLAAIAFRTGYFSELPDGSKSPEANRILYTVDARQSLHFQMVFECAYQAGFADRDRHDLVHVAFGTMMSEDGKPFKTREGGTVKLMDLLDEAERRARDLVEAKQADLPDGQPRLSGEEKDRIAHIVGIGGVKYADLAQNRTSDYVFSWDKMLSLQGNTAPYMQYAYARVRSIFQKGFPDEAERKRVETDLQKDASPIPVTEPSEAALAKMLLRFPETLDRALADYRPNVLAAYLFDLAQAFTAFYDACPVLKSEEPTRTHRLRLCDLTARAIAKGLALLGIETAERM
jgi:arginyl-tRNA synthetase